MEVVKLYAHLDSVETVDGSEALLNEFLVDALALYESKPESGESIAYEIAGLLGTKAFIGSNHNNPYVVIATIASQLELPLAHRSPGISWEQMAELIRALV